MLGNSNTPCTDQLHLNATAGLARPVATEKIIQRPYNHDTSMLLTPDTSHVAVRRDDRELHRQNQTDSFPVQFPALKC